MQFDRLKRRSFVTLLGGAAAWPFAARSQQGERVRRVGVLLGFAESDRDWQARLSSLRSALQELGWSDGRNMRLDVRWAQGDPERARAAAADLVGQSLDVLVACPHFAVAAAHRETRTTPVVGIQAGDFVTARFAQSHARPGGNITGFTLFEAAINTKFLQLLKDIAPRLSRVTVMGTPRHGGATSPPSKRWQGRLLCSQPTHLCATLPRSKTLWRPFRASRMPD